MFPLCFPCTFSEEEQSDRIVESIGGQEDLLKHENSVAEGNQGEDAEINSSDTEESKEEDTNSGERDDKNAAGTSHAPKGSDKEDASRSEEAQEPAVTREGCSEVPDEMERSDSQGNQADDANPHPVVPDESNRITSAASDSEEAENSDNEPLVLIFIPAFQLYTLPPLYASFIIPILFCQMQGVWKRRAGKLVEGK